MKKTGILGLGNLLLADEGFGVHCVQRIEDNFDLPDGVLLLDGGTAGIMLAPFIEDLDRLFVLDTVALDAPPGTIHCFTDSDVRSGNFQLRMSPHQVGLLEILDLCRLRDKAPEYVEMLTVVPEDLSTRIGLSATIAAKVDDILHLLEVALAKQDIRLISKTQPTGTSGSA